MTTCMLHNPIILDLETQNSFQDVGNDLKKLKVSVVGIYEYATNQYLTFREEEFPQLFPKLEKASMLVGFNINKFDLPVLAPYYVGKMEQFHTLDMLEEVEKVLGFRVSLDNLAQATLNLKKSGHGLKAIEFYRNNEWEKLISYCLDDVRITRELYEYGLKNNEIYFNDFRGKKAVKVNFEKEVSSESSVSLSLPF